jgi:NADPH2:quinone reductase
MSEAALRAIAWEGRLLVIGFAAGEIPKLPLNLTLLKGCDILGVNWGAFVRRYPDAYRAGLDALAQWGAEGKLSCHIHAVYPLAETAQALKAIAGRKAMGKVILRP